MRLSLRALAALSFLSLAFSLPGFFSSSQGPQLDIEDENENGGQEDAKKPDKYFHEVGGSLVLSHYDNRFFAGEVSYADHRLVLRNLIRSYLATMDAHDVQTWLAHGTLLGWWWNGRSMPWDYDLDVQVADRTMAWLARHMNGTRHAHHFYTEEEEGKGEGKHKSKGDDGDGRVLRGNEYLLDVSPHHEDLKDKEGRNIIDARWIDLSTGMFIDITAVRERNPLKMGVWSCKNNHRYTTGDLWPLRSTEFEGVPAKVPHAFEQILVKEYGDECLTLEEFERHRWDRDIQEWVKMTEEETERVRGMAIERKKQDLKRQGRL